MRTLLSTRALLILGGTLLTVGLSGCSTVASILSPSAVRDGETNEVVEGGRGDIFALGVGDCFNDEFQAGGEADSVPQVPCDEPHDNEVYFAADLPDEDWPGVDAVIATAQEWCDTEFAGFVGIPATDSELVGWPVYPTEESWDRLDDREVLCAVSDMNAQTTGSLAGAAK